MQSNFISNNQARPQGKHKKQMEPERENVRGGEERAEMEGGGLREDESYWQGCGGKCVNKSSN